MVFKIIINMTKIKDMELNLEFANRNSENEKAMAYNKELYGNNKMNDHRLKECPESPNCVSTRTQQKSKRMDPIPFELDPEEVRKVIKGVVESLPNTHLEKESTHYLHYTFKSKIFGFTDDVEFLIDGEQKLIHFRSASRSGYSDLGVNKKRMTEIAKSINQGMKNRTTSQ